jgi:hypothetical protein
MGIGVLRERVRERERERLREGEESARWCWCKCESAAATEGVWSTIGIKNDRLGTTAPFFLPFFLSFIPSKAATKRCLLRSCQ